MSDDPFEGVDQCWWCERFVSISAPAKIKVAIESDSYGGYDVILHAHCLLQFAQRETGDQ